MSKKMQKEMLRGPRGSTQERGEDGTAAKHRPSPPFAPGEAAASAARRRGPGQPTCSRRQSPTQGHRGERATPSRSDAPGEDACNNNNNNNNHNKTPRHVIGCYSENTKTLTEAACSPAQTPSRNWIFSGAALRRAPGACSGTGETEDQRRASGSAPSTANARSRATAQAL